MTTSSFGTQTDIPTGLPMRPRGPGRTAPAETLTTVTAEAPAVTFEEEFRADPLEAGRDGEPTEVRDAEPTAEPQEHAEPTAEPQEHAEPRGSEDALVSGAEASAAARAAARAAADDLGLSAKSAELLHSLLVLSATDLARGFPWRVHGMSARDWYEGFLFEDASSWLMGVGEAFSMRAFRTAMSGADALAAFNSLSLLCLTPGVREETSAGVQALLADQPRITRILAAANI